MSKKVVLKLDLHDDKEKQRALRSVSKITGIDSIVINMKDENLTVTGEIDPVKVAGKLRKKNRYVEMLTVGPAKEEKEKEEPKNKNTEADRFAELLKAQPNYCPCVCRFPIVEDHPTGCIIC